MSAEPESKPPYSQFDPVQLGEYIALLQKGGSKNFVTFLIGAGCSKSAGIPLAGEIVSELREEAKTHPLLSNAGSPPATCSEYAFLMEKLGSPKERAQRIKKYVDRARDENGRLKINWSHLLLAAMVEKGCVNRILTTNFDPLIVEALALTGQPIRTYDLNTSGKYHPGTLDEAAIIYMHGQMHSLFLANAPGEMERVRVLYPSVLQEAVQDSLLIVVGYSGDCDPVLDSLVNLPNFPLGLWWSHYSPSGNPLGEGFNCVVKKHGADCHLATGHDSDMFMRKLVVDGMKLDLPDEVLKPITAARIDLERITKFPILDPKEIDPVRNAIELLQRAEQLVASPATPAVVEVAPSTGKPAKPRTQAEPKLKDLSLVIQVNMAALTQKWEEFDQLVATVQPDLNSELSQAIGDGFLRRAGYSINQKNFADAFKYLASAEKYGLTDDMKPWLPTVIGNALSAQAQLKGNTPEADRLFAEASQKYAAAVRIKPDMHEAFDAWGIALSDQAQLKGNTPEADRLFAAAAQKFGEAVRLKPDMHEAFDAWGIALLVQARLKGNTPEADRLFAAAAQKFAEAVRLKPDDHEAFSNWGAALSDQAQLKGNTPEADRLFAEAAQKYAAAVRLKPDKHEAFSNWGNALWAQAQLKGNTPEADRLFAEAAQKFGEAVRLKPDMHGAFSNWGIALLDQARLKGNTPEADRLFAEAAQKYAEAVRLKPDNESAHFNLGCLAALLGQVRECCESLAKWKQYNQHPKKSDLDLDADFDRVRNAPEFQAFRESLPE